MHIRDVLEKCKIEGYPLSYMGVYIVGKREGFITKIEGKKELDFNKEKFFEWLDKAKQKAPEGYSTPKQICEKYKISLTKVYAFCKNNPSIVKRIGSGKGVIYVNSEGFEKVITKHNNRNKVNWEK